MADSNSKKPMALLLLVVVAVLVVIMVSGGEEEVHAWAGHTALTDDKSCTDAMGTWTPGADKDDEATEGVDESKGTCAAPTDYAGFTKEQCSAAHGDWTETTPDDEATEDVDESAGTCAAKKETKEEDGNKAG